MQVEVNYVAVLLAAVASMAVGFVWYSKPVFGSMWLKLIKMDEKKQEEGAGLAIASSLVMALVTGYIIAHVTYILQKFYGVSFLESGIQTAFFLWLGIAMTTIVKHGLFEGRRKKLIALTVLHELVTLLAMGAVIGALRP